MTEQAYSRLARPRGMMDAMVRYQGLYGFKAIGRHRGLVHTCLGNITETCVNCEGTGLFQLSAGVLIECPTCRGYGVVYSISEGEFQGWRQVILAAYPDSGPPDWVPCVPYRQQEWTPEDIQEQLRMIARVDKVMQERYLNKEPPKKD
jgi:hypothetical protein